ncbi:MAG: cytochrome c3 family protein [Coriobacteriales bacterium]|jgi:hypothetical protein|nr:cytochrome c3 family protein [Coriobacteriales bacterium]
MTKPETKKRKMPDAAPEAPAAPEIPEAPEAPAVPAATPQGVRRRVSRTRVILIAVVAVLVLLAGGAGVAYAATHDDPRFCNFLCHTPMDPYVASYLDGTSVNPAQAGRDVLLSVTAHKESGQDIGCLTCHEPSVAEQVHEGLSWVRGGYDLPLEGLVVSKTPQEGQKDAESFCLRPGCHEATSVNMLAKTTNFYTRNPHMPPADGQHEAGDCTSCHKVHEQSVNTCAQCHYDAALPEGWTKERN